MGPLNIYIYNILTSGGHTYEHTMVMLLSWNCQLGVDLALTQKINSD